MKTSSTIHKDHRQRMKDSFENNGFFSFTDIQKLEFLLFFAIPQKDVNPLAHRLLNEFGSFNNVINADYESLVKVNGVGKHTAMLIKTVQSVAVELHKKTDAIRISESLLAKQLCHSNLKHSNVEEFFVICLSANNKIITSKKINSGSATKVKVEISDITKLAFHHRACKIIVAHNHPNETLRFSDDDLALTYNIITSCFLNGIILLDHILVTPESALSLSEMHGLSYLEGLSIKRLNLFKPMLADPACPYEEYIISNPNPDPLYFEKEYGRAFAKKLDI